MADLRWAFFIFLGLVLLALPQAMTLPLIDRDEPRFSEASREMIERGDYIVPYFNGVPRYQKPPGIYWCQVVCFELLGETELVARLPSVLAAAGVGLILFFWARRAGEGRLTGLQAAVITVLSFQMMQQGRVATADSLLVFWMTLTSWLGWEWSLAELHANRCESRWLWLGMVASFAGGFLTKGPEAWLPGISLLIWAATTERAGERMLKVPAAVLVSTLPVLLWAIPAYIDTKGAYWSDEIQKHMGGAMFTSMDQHGSTNFLGYLASLPFYLLLIWVSTLPWSPLVAFYGVGLWTASKKRDNRHQALDTYLLRQAGVIFVMFTLMVTKLPHYTLPALPLIGLIFARRWNLAHGKDRLQMLPSLLSVGLAAVVIAVTSQMGHLSMAKELARQAADQLKAHPDMPFATVTYHEASVTWEMRRYLHGFQQEIGEQEVHSYLSQPGPRVLIGGDVFRYVPLGHIGTQSTDNDPKKHFYGSVGLDTARFRQAWLGMEIKDE